MSTPPPLGISSADWALTPPTVRLVLLALIEQQQQLARRVADLEAQLAKHSGNSSKPPSSDPPSAPPKPPKPKTERKRGAQKSHTGTYRPLVPPDQVSEFVVHRPSVCSCCHSAIPLDLVADAIERHQVWELPPLRPIVIEHQLLTLHCPSCHAPQRAERGADMPHGAFGANVTALVAVLRGRYHLSTRAVVSLLDEVLGIPLSLGCVPRLQETASMALVPVYNEVQTAVRSQAVLNVDETPWKECGTQRYLWAAVSRVGTLFQIERRTQAALVRLLGAEFSGMVGSDRYGAYHLIPLERRQICWAHLKRDWTFFAERDGPVGHWGEAGVAQIRRLFEVWHRFRGGESGREAMQREMEPIQAGVWALLDEGRDRLPWEKARGFCREMRALWEGLWTFVREEGVEPTNNAAEQDVRPAVLWRKGSYGSQSEAGSRFVERILTVVTTARRQGRNVLAFVADAIRASWTGQLAPLLISTP